MPQRCLHYHPPSFDCDVCSLLCVFVTEAVIRMSMLNNISSLLEKSSMLGYIEEELQGMQEGIMEIPIRMLRDVHDQVCVCVCIVQFSVVYYSVVQCSVL